MAFKMSDSESNGSVTASEQSDDYEDIVVQSSVVKPYMYEPEATSEYNDNPADEDGILRDTLEARWNKTVAVTSWYVRIITDIVVCFFQRLYSDF